MKSMNKRISIVLCMIMLIVSAAGMKAFAADPVLMPDLLGEDGTLRILTQYTDEDKVTQINGVELVAFKVADMYAKNGNVQFKPTSDFANVEVNYDGMTAAQSLEAAKLLYAEALNKQLVGIKRVSQDGVADFGNVPFGMYLIAQTAAESDSKNYKGIEPFLVMVPQTMIEMGVNDWNYEVVSIPKMVKGTYEPPEKEKKVKGEYEDESKKKKKTKSAKTGDYTDMYIWAALLMTAAIILIITGMLRRRRRQDN